MLDRTMKESNKIGISRIVIAIVIVVIIIVAGIGAVLLSISRTSTTSTTPITSTGAVSTTSSTTLVGSSATTTTVVTSTSPSTIPSSLAWETTNTPSFLDPDVSYTSFDYNVLQNIYEPLLWYYKANSTEVIPWLASNYTAYNGFHTYNFTLRSGIVFADGENLNSTAVYFSLNRLLIEDGSTPEGHGAQASWILQQLLNSNLSSYSSGPQNYTQQWVNEVLAENFVQITGPLSFTINVQQPNSAFPFLLANVWAAIIAPGFVMQHDLALWNQSSTGYKLPYDTLSRNLMSQISQYFYDEVATCDAGATPKGCATTYLDGSYQGSLAGTGPYVLKSFSSSTNDFVLQSNTNYWGGPYKFMGGAKIAPKIQTININYVPQESTRELDLQNAARSGQALTVDITADHLYDIANRSAWLSGNKLLSIMNGVSIYGPYSQFATYFYPFDMNVTNALTGKPYTFQPFADIRFRLAFADSVNITEINQDINNKMGTLADNLMPPGLPPNGVYNPTITPKYSYNLSAVQDLLLSAMMHPLTRFTYTNGTLAALGVFNNTFGCTALNSKGQCDKPVFQSISLAYDTGDTVAENLLNQIATAINNVSATYNMGLSVSITPYPFGTYITDLISGYFYMYWAAIFSDYPWALDFLGPIYATAFVSIDGWNITQMKTLFNQAESASAAGNNSGIVEISNEMNALGNEQVMYLWAYYPALFQPMTSNVQGVQFNPSLSGTIQYFAELS